MLCMLLILLQIQLLNGQYTHGTPSNGKLVRDMRTFVNVTFDWSPPEFLNSTHSEYAIPKCHHEFRIRMSYYGRSIGIVSYVIAKFEKNMRTGHLVYPFVMTVTNGSVSQEYFAAGVHKVYSEEDAEKIKGNVIALYMISEGTWRHIWTIWSTIGEHRMETCNGGTYFDDIIPFIYSDEKLMKQYNDIVGNYTDATSDVCDISSCDIPCNQTETLTFAYPNQEGLEQLPSHFSVSTARLFTDLMLAGLIHLGRVRELRDRKAGGAEEGGRSKGGKEIGRGWE